VNILGGHSIGPSEQNYTVQMSNKTMSSQELQSALMLTVEYSKVYNTR
jgi:hypothetical protein